MSMDPTFPLSGFPLSSSGTPATSSAAPSPSVSAPPALLALNTVPNSSTCQSATIGWTYTGTSDADLSLNVVTGINLHNGPIPEVFFNHSIATNVDAASGSYTWASINVPAGWYKVEAILPGFVTSSPSFFVANGTSMTCLPSPSSTASPVSDVAGLTSSQRAGAIAGGVIGGVLIIVAALLALLFLRRRRAPTRARARSDANIAPRDMHKWNGLSSRESGMEVGLPIAKDASGKMQLRKTSYESSNITGSNAGHAVATRDVSDEDLSTLNEEEPPASHRSEYIEAVLPPEHDVRLSTSTLAESHRGSIHRGRAQSVNQGHRSAALANVDSASAPTSPRHAARRSTDVSAYPLSPLSGNIPMSPPLPADMNRSSSGAGVGRRPTRKPVPQYGAEHAGDRASVAESVYGSATPARSREDLRAPDLPGLHLNHKSSFGAGDMRPMHVLIPDMPPPPRE
ncbi:hypothetical protein B0H21DRAFT_492093 [Amylocystis lapponica]|nr:hypothetical protein B0H21DRAFT_492093 [Amylocystis lapponica]